MVRVKFTGRPCRRIPSPCTPPTSPVASNKRNRQQDVLPAAKREKSSDVEEGEGEEDVPSPSSYPSILTESEQATAPTHMGGVEVDYSERWVGVVVPLNRVRAVPWLRCLLCGHSDSAHEGHPMAWGKTKCNVAHCEKACPRFVRPKTSEAYASEPIDDACFTCPHPRSDHCPVTGLCRVCPPDMCGGFRNCGSCTCLRDRHFVASGEGPGSDMLLHCKGVMSCKCKGVILDSFVTSGSMNTRATALKRAEQKAFPPGSILEKEREALRSMRTVMEIKYEEALSEIDYCQLEMDQLQHVHAHKEDCVIAKCQQHGVLRTKMAKLESKLRQVVWWMMKMDEDTHSLFIGALRQPWEGIHPVL